MIGDLGAPELLIILAIVILLFGVGKVGRLGKDLGTAVREFRSAVRDEDDKPPAATAQEQPAPPVAVAPAAASMPSPPPAAPPVVASRNGATTAADRGPKIF